MAQPMNAVIAALNSQYVHSSLAPFYLLAGIRMYGNGAVHASVVEGTINEMTQAVVERILQAEPDAVCLCCYIWNIEKTLEIARRIKAAKPEVHIVLGGPEVSYNAEQVLSEHRDVDYIVSGEGERPLLLLLCALQSGGETAGIPGLCYRDVNGIHIGAPYVSFSDPPSPYLPEYFASLGGRIAYIETSRGCPFSCAFCLSGRQGGARYFALDRVKDEIFRIANSGTKTVKFVDRTFNANRDRARELFSFILENLNGNIPSGVRFHFEIAGDLLDQGTLELLANAPPGVFQFEIGLQSFNGRTLESVRRKTDLLSLKQNIRTLGAKGNIHLHIDLIAGLPHEDWDSMRNSFNEAYLLSPDMLQLGFLKLLHGAAMRDQTQYPCEFMQKPPYEVIRTPWLENEELRNLHCVADALDRLYNSGRFRRTLGYLLQSTGTAPFELFCCFGTYADKNAAHASSLEGYMELLYRFFIGKDGVEGAVLRDQMVCDRLSTNSSGYLPKFLRIEDAALRHVRMVLEREEQTKKPEGVKRAVAILYAQKCAVYVDYSCADPVTGEYELKQCPASLLDVQKGVRR